MQYYFPKLGFVTEEFQTSFPDCIALKQQTSKSINYTKDWNQSKGWVLYKKKISPVINVIKVNELRIIKFLLATTLPMNVRQTLHLLIVEK